MKKPVCLVEGVLHPGKHYSVDAAKFAAMRLAIHSVLPAFAPGLTVAELGAAVQAHLPQDLFPGGATAGWWVKCVQLDQEAKGVILRTRSTPLRLYLA